MSHSLVQLLRLDRFGWRSLIDILVLTIIIYQLLRIFRGTRAFRMLSGILVLAMAYILTGPGRTLALPTVNRVLGALLLLAPLAIVVLFQNHIRRMLAIVGSNPLAGLQRSSGGEKMVEEIVLAAATLSQKRHGALIVLEREQGLRTFAETGIELDAVVSYDLLTTIFMPHTPLHDGAVVIADGRIRAASCFLPLTTGARLSREYGSRHRAAIGISEETDAIALVVSEETGAVSLVRDGRIRRGLEPQELRAALLQILAPPHPRRRPGAAHEEAAAPRHAAATPDAAPGTTPPYPGSRAHDEELIDEEPSHRSSAEGGAAAPAGTSTERHGSQEHS
jgi:diadenylate cyclase